LLRACGAVTCRKKWSNHTLLEHTVISTCHLPDLRCQRMTTLLRVCKASHPSPSALLPSSNALSHQTLLGSHTYYQLSSRFLGERDGAEEPLRLRACIYLCGLVVPCGCCVHVMSPKHVCRLLPIRNTRGELYDSFVRGRRRREDHGVLKQAGRGGGIPRRRELDGRKCTARRILSREDGRAFRKRRILPAVHEFV